jgi:hypothetical protein
MPLAWSSYSGRNSPVDKTYRTRIEPLAEQQFGFFIGQSEVTRWHFSNQAPRPYFFPVNGPSGTSLTRMGHPGAPNHDHHRSFWFAHNELLGIDFWSENTPARIRQSQWYAIEDGDDLARIAFELVWSDGHDPQPLLKQDVFVTLRPVTSLAEMPGSKLPEWTLELQSDFRATAEGVEFRQSNFGVLGLRVAKSLSVVFGGGVITGADGFLGEPDLFGKPNRWLDYSGPIYSDLPTGSSISSETSRGPMVEGLTLIDHCLNPDHPVSWHVREDGWIGPSLSRHRPLLVPRDQPLTCRYLLYAHSGGCNPERANQLADQFDASPPLRVQKGTRPHHQFEIIS